MLFDRFGGDAGRELQRPPRPRTCARLARQLDPDPEHAEHTARLATELFDRTATLHGLDEHARELLHAAAMVHNVGLFISHSSHHKHSYYVIRNSEQMTGFTDHEIELIAVVARYHRKSLPADKHAEFGALSKQDQRLVRILAGLLRVAIGLDRRHAATVRSVRVFIDDDRHPDRAGRASPTPTSTSRSTPHASAPNCSPTAWGSRFGSTDRRSPTRRSCRPDLRYGASTHKPSTGATTSGPS